MLKKWSKESILQKVSRYYIINVYSLKLHCPNELTINAYQNQISAFNFKTNPLEYFIFRNIGEILTIFCFYQVANANNEEKSINCFGPTTHFEKFDVGSFEMWAPALFQCNWYIHWESVILFSLKCWPTLGRHLFDSPS